MKNHKTMALYLMLRHEPASGQNRGREFYDGHCQSCDSDVYETHQDSCEYAAMLLELGGDEEAERQARRRAHRDAELQERKERLGRHRRGVTTSSLDSMNLAFKKMYGGFGE
mgnify:CR=1 FL=1